VVFLAVLASLIWFVVRWRKKARTYALTEPQRSEQANQSQELSTEGLKNPELAGYGVHEMSDCRPDELYGSVVGQEGYTGVPGTNHLTASQIDSRAIHEM